MCLSKPLKDIWSVMSVTQVQVEGTDEVDLILEINVMQKTYGSATFSSIDHIAERHQRKHE